MQQPPNKRLRDGRDFSDSPWLNLPKQDEPPIQKPKNSKTKQKIANLCVWLGAGLGLAIFVKTHFKDDPRVEAYEAAKTFTTRAYPGAKSFSAIDESPVTVNNGVYRVQLLVNGVNSFNAPIQNQVIVLEVLNGNNWNLVSIEQQ